MKILVITQQNSGVGYHRLMLPVYFMPKTYALLTDTLTDEVLAEGYDILFVNRFIPTLHIDQLLLFKKKYGFRLVVDIDDYWNLDSWHILSQVYPTQAILDHIAIADLVTCTNEGLWNEIRPINSNVAILPNALPYGEDQFTDDVTKDDKIRFIYAGSITHEKDLRLVQFPFKKVLSDTQLRSKVHFRICGLDDPNEYSKAIWHKMIHYFTAGLRLGDVQRAMPVTEYMNFYNNADCSVVPLVASKFNGLKSNLKVLEAACKKIPVIVSNTAPYDTCKYAIKVDNQGDWYKHIKKVANDPGYRLEAGMANYEWCNENYNLHKINVTRKQLFENLI
jgi:glycosyltransferase involved in cell wall biosynthesis